jgi:putative heme-binding domain-containing protein
MLRPRLLVCLTFAFITTAAVATIQAAEPDFKPADPQLRAVLVDSSPKESFLSVRADAAGRLFVGGREALFVYEPQAGGAYGPRQELYRFPKDTWVNDIEVRGDDLYVATVAAVYVLPGAVTKRTGIRPKRLVSGVPLGHVHQCLHGLAWGPEGDLYISMGDPLWYYGDFQRPDHWGHWTFFTQPEGTQTPYNGVGGVFRCRPDGSHFQIVARGLRNSVGLTFDHHWNLFTNDNDHEGLPAQYVPGRLLYVVPHTYFSWPRGWLPSKTPERADLLDTVVDKLGRFVPVGQSYYDDPLLGEPLRNNLLVARWCIGSVTRYPLEVRGAEFKAHEFHLLDGRNQARPVGVCEGRGGRLFVTISYMAQNEGSPIYRSDLVMLAPADDPAAAPFAGYDIAKATDDKLFDELGHDSWHRRQRAHIELLRRGGSGLARAAEELSREKVSHADSPATREHLIWLAASSGKPGVGEQLQKLTRSGSPQAVRLQALRALGEKAELRAPRELFVGALADHDPQLQLAALVGLFRFAGPPPAEVASGPARSSDTYLRQLATLLLAEKSSLSDLDALAHSADRATRLAATLAIGFRLTLPPATERIKGRLDKLREESSYVIQYADKKLDLRDFGPVGNYTVADHWHGEAHNDEQERMFDALVHLARDPEPSVRLEAVHFLSVLNDPRSEPIVAQVVQANEEVQLSLKTLSGVTQVWLIGPFDDGDQGFDRPHPPEQGPVDLAQSYSDHGTARSWHLAKTKRKFELTELLGPMDHASCYAYFRFESNAANRAQLLVGSDDGVKIWQNGRPVWANDVSRAALPLQDVVPLVLQPGSNDMLVRVRNRSGDCGLYINYRALGSVAVELPEKVDTASLAERLASAGKSGGAAVSRAFLQVDWQRAVADGDPKQGRRLFEAIGCAKCHATSATTAGTGGPSLAEAGRRFTVSHLVESILTPGKQISPVFRATQVVLDDGRQFQGLVVGETADKLELLLSDTKRVQLLKRQIERRELVNQSPMPQGVVKTPEELRDILAFLMRGT